MNLNSVVAPLTGVVNPRETVTLYPSSGYTTAADGSRAPSYANPVSVLASLQDVSHQELNQLDGVNLSTQNMNVYLPGDWLSVLRPDGKGGDLLVRADGTKWLIVSVPEQWGGASGWTKVIITRQLN